MPTGALLGVKSRSLARSLSLLLSLSFSLPLFLAAMPARIVSRAPIVFTPSFSRWASVRSGSVFMSISSFWNRSAYFFMPILARNPVTSEPAVVRVCCAQESG